MDTFTFSGIDENRNNISVSAIVTLQKGSNGQICVASTILENEKKSKGYYEPISKNKYEKFFASASDELNTLRFFRDNILSKNLKGLSMIKLYYKYSPEVIEIIMANDDLKSRAADAIRELIDIIKNSYNINDSIQDFVNYAIPMWLKDEIYSLLDDISQHASDELKEAIDNSRKSFDN